MIQPPWHHPVLPLASAPYSTFGRRLYVDCAEYGEVVDVGSGVPNAAPERRALGLASLIPPAGGVGRVTWMPDSSAVAIELPYKNSIDVVTIADGKHRTQIEDAVAASWSPDGSHIAYLRCVDVPDSVDMPRDTVPADLAGANPMQPGASRLGRGGRRNRRAGGGHGARSADLVTGRQPGSSWATTDCSRCVPTAPA